MAKGTSGYFIICFTFYYIFWIINIFWRDQEKGKVLKETGNWIGGYLICIFSMCLIGKEPNTHNLFWEIYIIQSQMHCATLKYISNINIYNIHVSSSRAWCPWWRWWWAGRASSPTASTSSSSQGTGGTFYKVHFIRLEVNMSICQKIGSHLICWL